MGLQSPPAWCSWYIHIRCKTYTPTRGRFTCRHFMSFVYYLLSKYWKVNIDYVLTLWSMQSYTSWYWIFSPGKRNTCYRKILIKKIISLKFLCVVFSKYTFVIERAFSLKDTGSSDVLSRMGSDNRKGLTREPQEPYLVEKCSSAESTSHSTPVPGHSTLLGWWTGSSQICPHTHNLAQQTEIAVIFVYNTTR